MLPHSLYQLHNDTSFLSLSYITMLLLYTLTLIFSAWGPDAPVAHPFRSSLTTSQSSPSLGMSSRMSALLTWMGMGPLFEMTFPKRRAMHSAVWEARDILLAFGQQSVVALHHPLKLHHANVGSLVARCPSIFSEATDAHFLRSLWPGGVLPSNEMGGPLSQLPPPPYCCPLLVCTHVGTEIHWLHGCVPCH